ncbi:MAG: hypothetical protein FJY99_13110 [Candidatus Sericytochromatia bacterium]|nr:hypothetical protein [Candidatus Tanganyikabacteria bacterium]
MHTIPGILAVIGTWVATGDLPPSGPALLASRMQVLAHKQNLAALSGVPSARDLDRTAAALEDARLLTRDPLEADQLAHWAIALREARHLAAEGRAQRMDQVLAALERRILRWRLRIESRPAVPLGSRRPVPGGTPTAR